MVLAKNRSNVCGTFQQLCASGRGPLQLIVAAEIKALHSQVDESGGGINIFVCSTVTVESNRSLQFVVKRGRSAFHNFLGVTRGTKIAKDDSMR